MDKRKIFDKFILMFLMISPILDLIAYFQDKYINIPISISYIIRGLFLLVILIYLLRKRNDRKLLFIFLIYFILALSSYFMRKLNIYTELVNVLKIFYLPILMFFFSKYKNEKINDKFVLKIYALYIITFIVMYIFKIDRFYLNTIGVILVGLLPIVLNYIMESKNYILKIGFALVYLLCIYLISTKLIVIGSFIVILISIVSKYKYEIIYNDFKDKLKYLALIFVFVCLYVLFIRFTPFYSNIKADIIALNIHSFRDVYRFKTIDNIIFSGGITRIDAAMGPLLKNGYETIMYGLGKSALGEYTRIDIFDIFATTGLFGGIVFIIMFSFIHRKTELKKVYYFSYLVFVIVSIFAGSVLIYPSISLLLSTLYIISSNAKEDVKKKYY